jgi:hypothetical protein
VQQRRRQLKCNAYATVVQGGGTLGKGKPRYGTAAFLGEYIGFLPLLDAS